MRRRLRKKLVRKILLEETMEPISLGLGRGYLAYKRFNWRMYYDAIDKQGMSARAAIRSTRMMWRRQWKDNRTIIRRFSRGKLAIGFSPTPPPPPPGMVRGVPILSKVIPELKRLEAELK